MKNASLYFKEGSSDKEYHLQLEEVKGGYVINFQYGRVGNALQSGTKTTTPVTIEEAEKIYAKIYKEKTAKGYAESGEKKNDYSQIDHNKPKEVIILPQLLNAIEDAEQYINDGSYLAQEKYDGERRMIIYNSRTVIGINKKGTEVPLPKSIIVEIELSDAHDCILDGEIIGDTFFAFDILSLNGKDLKGLRFNERIATLSILRFGVGIEVVPTAYTKSEKRKLFDRLKSENKEGIVFKKKDSPYTVGRPASGGNQLKFKFQKSGTFIVANHTKGKRSVGLELVIEEKENGLKTHSTVGVGKVTIPPNHKVPEVGELVEVQYLYAYRDGAIFQPVYLGIRNDSDLTDATIHQLIYKGETVE